MTDTAPLPAVRASSDLDDLARLGIWLAWSEAGEVDKRPPAAKGAAAALRLYYARELGLTPMAAAELTLIKGRLYVSAELLRALADRAGYKTERLNDDRTTCTARISRRSTGEVLGQATFTIEDAKVAGLIRQGSPWTTHPARMLWARASKNVIKDFAPGVALGIALDDELQEVAPAALTGNGDIPWTDADAEVIPDYRPDPEQDELPLEPDEEYDPDNELELEEDDPATDGDGVDTDDIAF